jgi:ATP synthase subunit 6
MFSPLEQFRVIPVTILAIYEDIYYITSLDFSYLLITVFFLILFKITSHSMKLIPGFYQSLVETLYFFILRLLIEQATFHGTAFFPLIFFNFLFILITNITSLLPFSFSVTAQFVTVFIIACSFNLLFLMTGLRLHGFAFFYLFYRKDLTLALRLLLVPIEIFSYFLRPISLSVRLFANMLAGHTLMHIITSFLLVLLGTVPTTIDIFLLIVLAAIFLLELGVAFLQAFIFTILLSIYLHDAYFPRH